MNLDVCILAGGLGTRLSGIWDGPKCLVPITGKPLLLHLLERVAVLRPRIVCLALGHLSREVIRWIITIDDDPIYSVETSPLGTAGALRLAIQEMNLQAPILVLNGDTLPRYDLARLVAFHDRVGNVEAVVAVQGDKHAGAAVLNPPFLLRLTSTDETDLDALLRHAGASRYYAPGFLDVGTPYGFYCSQHLKGYP